MDPQTWQTIEDLFLAAAPLSPEGRQRLLDEQPGLEQSVRVQVEALLEADQSGHPLLDWAQTPELPEGTRVGQYRLLSILGKGGMGTVYLAERADHQFEKQVAIKLVNQGLAELVQGGRFERERHILANLEHPNIARLLDAGVGASRQPYLVMEWADGVPLDAWLRDRQPSLDARLNLWLAVAEAVSYAHRNLIVHRDIKPSNILVTAGDVPKLVDFGIAKLLDDAAQDVTATRAFTPRYASPEQKTGATVTTASDQYSLGLVLSEMTAGCGPVPRDLAAVISLALREDPADRYASVDHFADDVRRFRKGLPVTARAENAGYVVRKFIGRHKWGVSAAAFGFVLLSTVTTVAIVQADRASRQLARANQVTEFFSTLMGIVPTNAPSTLRSKGASLRVADLVDSVSSRLQHDVAGQPEAEASIRYVVGSVYNELGLFEKAHPHSQRAAALFASQRDPGDRERTAAEILEGNVLAQLGKFQEAEKVFLEARSHWKNPSAYTVAALESTLGIAQLRLAKRDAAEATFLHCLKVMEEGLGNDNPWVGLVLSNLSLVYQERGDFERSRQILEKARAVASARRAESPEALGWAALNLAVVNRILDSPDAALAAGRESVDAFRDSMGESSPPAAQALTQVAWALARLSKPDAEANARKALAIEEEKLPAGHSERAVGLTWLGFVLLQENKLAEARSRLEQAIEIRRKSFPNSDWRTLPAAGFLGEVLYRQGERDRGLTLLRDNLSTLSAQFGAANPRTKDAQARLNRYFMQK